MRSERTALCLISLRFCRAPPYFCVCRQLPLKTPPPTTQLSPMNPDHNRCLQAHRQSPSPRHLRKHTIEGRALLSAGITRLQRSYDPDRLPLKPPARSDVEAATLTP